MNYKFEDISQIIKGKVQCRNDESLIQNVIYDTRKISFALNSIFFAFKGSINDGHDYLEEAYKKGVRNFVVSKKVNTAFFKEANILLVNSSLQALQTLAKYHRNQYNIKIIAITGSNGKTIIKEWLGKSLSKKYRIVKSPKSYNSQIGVALSLLQIDDKDELAIIEAGISKKHEMRFLERMIKPNIGIFSNLGDAHSFGFDSMQQKLDEKLQLFKSAEKIIYCGDQKLVSETIEKVYPDKTFSWSREHNSKIKISGITSSPKATIIDIEFDQVKFSLHTKLVSKEFLENLMHVVSCLLLLDCDPSEVQTMVNELDQIQNRLELREGLNGNLLINDSYSLDMASMQLALEFQDLHAKDLEKVLIFSDFDQQLNKQELFTEVNRLIYEKKITKVFAIGLDEQYHGIFSGQNIQFYETGSSLLSGLDLFRLKSNCILIKGARRFHLENVFHKLSRQVHETVLETSFSALDHNLNVYKSFLKAETKVMAVIKADAYGSGIVRMAQYLEQKNIDYLAVAIVDEAIQIRESGCHLPIMVFNVQHDQIEMLWEYDLEPEVYSLQLLEDLRLYSNRTNKSLKVHLKVDTGMHRLGFEEADVPELLERLENNSNLKVKSVFSHLAASENPALDAFTNQQIEKFNFYSQTIISKLPYSVLRHILNTGGIIRFSDHQLDMVRIGLGLYGIDETGLIADKLEKVHRLKARVLQIKHLEAGEATSYGRSGKVDKPTDIAIVGIGYADGLMRLAGKNGYKMMLNGQLCPILGNVCMDVCMLDITHVQNVHAGDEVIVFDNELKLENLAESCQTISYEIISRIAPRVKRAYTYD